MVGEKNAQIEEDEEKKTTTTTTKGASGRKGKASEKVKLAGWTASQRATS